MAATRLDLSGDFAIDRGTTWAMELDFATTADGLTPGPAWDLTGATARVEFRPGYVNDAGKVVTLGAPVKTLTVGAGLAITPLTGVIVATLTPAETRAFVAGARLVYDLRIYTGAAEDRPIFGTVTVREQITAPGP